MAKKGKDDTKQRDAYAILENFCCRFHLVAKEIQQRHSGRQTLSINDEYDVQDLFRTLLISEFNDIRKEEWTPSYAGGSSRVDFLLKPEQIIVEVKKTRNGVGPKDLGEQLLIDISRYKVHPDCRTLICFTYDPEGRIPNPCGIENDLNGFHDDLTVKVIITPKGL